MPQNTKLTASLNYLLAWIGEGRRLSELPKSKRGIYAYAIKMGYVTESVLPHDRLINRARR